jgi:hypothetical protein
MRDVRGLCMLLELERGGLAPRDPGGAPARGTSVYALSYLPLAIRPATSQLQGWVRRRWVRAEAGGLGGSALSSA